MIVSTTEPKNQEPTLPENWMLDEHNHAILKALEQLRQRGSQDAAQFDALNRLYADTNSSWMTPTAFGDHAAAAKLLYARLCELGVVVRKTEPHFLWFYGKGGNKSLMAKCDMSLQAGRIYIDLVGNNQDVSERFDSFAQQAIHATGRALGRWHRGAQPRADINTGYSDGDVLRELAIATVGAVLILDRAGVGEPSTKKSRAKMVEILYTHHAIAVSVADTAAVLGRANEAFDFLMRPPRLRDKLAVAIRTHIQDGWDTAIGLYMRLANKQSAK